MRTVLTDAPQDVDEPAEAAGDPSQLTTAETAECQCPEFCERDHDLD